MQIIVPLTNHVQVSPFNYMNLCMLIRKIEMSVSTSFPLQKYFKLQIKT